MGFFSSSGDNNYLGIDIGNSSIKMVELSKKGKQISLENYGVSSNISGADFAYSEDIDFLAKALSKMKKEIGVKAGRASASLPSWSVFSSLISIYNPNKKKMKDQVIEEAKKVIPLPLDEMVLDWKLVPGDTSDKNDAKVFLTGSPKKLIKKYIDVFKEAKILLNNLETETFSLIRSLIGNDPATVMIIELGENSTDFSIVKESIPFLNRSINFSGKSISEEIAQKMGVEFAQAEQFKLDLSLSVKGKNYMPELIEGSIKPIVDEISYMSDLFYSSNNGQIDKIILSGGGALLYNLADYLEKTLNVKVLIGNPWFKISYPAELEPVLLEVGPKLSVASGLALRDADK